MLPMPPELIEVKKQELILLDIERKESAISFVTQIYNELTESQKRNFASKFEDWYATVRSADIEAIAKTVP